MDWRDLCEMLQDVPVPLPYAFEQLANEDVEKLCDLIGQWFPEIETGSESCWLDAEFYFTHVFLRGSTPSKDLYPIIFRDQARHIVAAMIAEKNDRARNISARLAIVDPTHRGSGVGALGPVLLENIGRAIGAEMAYFYATLRSPHQQALAEKHGYRLVGIVPAFDRDTIAKGVVKRVSEAIYVKVLVDPSQIFEPDPKMLTERTRRMLGFISINSESN